MTCTWCEKSAPELFPMPGKNGSTQMVCAACASLARSVAKWTSFLASARMPADGFLCEKCGQTHRTAGEGCASSILLN